MPTGFFLQRVFRSGLFINDFNLDKDEYYKKLGQAFYQSVWDDLENVKAERGAEQVFEIRVKDPSIWDNLHKHMSREVKLEVIFQREEKIGSRIRFRKKYKRTTRKLRNALNGKGETD
jgi:ATP-dependent RNA circularization protein (DNA/RNA ligase family)